MTTEFVVYILGAGASAPMGLPVMGNFLEKARDQFFIHKGDSRLFRTIFKLLDGLAKVKNYYSADLHNIEEVLSILTMQTSIDGSASVKRFTEFICEVI